MPKTAPFASHTKNLKKHTHRPQIMNES